MIFETEIQKLTGKALDAAVNTLIKDHAKSDQGLVELKASLANLASKKRIVILVDELDQSRPSYAVSFIETMKHIFDVQNVDFILVVNTKGNPPDKPLLRK